MPTDNRRISGPENTKPYSFYKVSSESETKKLLLTKNLRADKRKCDQMRPIYLKHGVVTQAKGSAYMELGETKVICSVFDPREIPRKSEYSVHGELYCEFKYATFACKQRRGHLADNEEKESSLTLRRALEAAVCRHEFPNFQVDIYALVLEDAGSALAAAITCAGAALADASVPMYDLVTASCLGVANGASVIDPTAAEEALCRSSDGDHGIVTVAYMTTQAQLSEVFQTGSMDGDCLTSALKMLVDACESVYPVAQQCVIKSIKESLKERKTEKKAEAS